MKPSSAGPLVVSIFTVVLARPAAGDDCGEQDLQADGRCPTQLDIQGVEIAGVEVSVDGKVVGQAPLVVKTAPGRHSVEVKRDGYKPYSAWVEVTQNKRKLVQVTLQRLEPPPPPPPPLKPCPDGMVRIPAGSFRMGSPDKVGKADEHPQHVVKLATYCIDKTEVTVKAYLACVAAKACTDSRGMDVGCNHNTDPRPLERPINCVSWDQSEAYCKWIAKRLPSEAEWEYAARGGDGRAYPWGNQAPSAKLLNACGVECVAMGQRLGRSEIAMHNSDDGWRVTAPPGSFPADKSPFGVLDMGGNVSEWTADWYGEYTAASATNPRGPAAGKERVIRGGSWHHGVPENVRAAYREHNDPGVSGASSYGFRCARGD